MHNREGEPRDRRDEEPGAEEEIEAPALDREASRAQKRDEPAREHEDRREDEIQFRQGIRMPKARNRDQYGERRPEQAEQQDLSPEKGFITIGPHSGSIGTIS